MDYFFQEQRWTDTFLSLHVNKVKRIFLLLLIAFSAAGAEAEDVPSSWQNVTFNENIRYSQWVINSRIRDFYGNKDPRGFNTYDATGNKTGDSKGTQKFDYVPGLVAKAVLEAYANYNTFDWSKPWFYSVMNYAKDKTYKLVATETQKDFSGITLDNMNACKMYFPLMAKGALSDGAKTTGETAIDNVLTDMKKYNSMYVIGGSESGVKNSTNDKVKSMFDGWFHKPEYKDQMWCDGLYMGAALLAQIIKYKGNVHNITASSDTNDDWDLIAKQFTISWKQLYDSSKGLLYHAFTANPKDNASNAWSGISNTTGSEVYHSEAFWGRAIGWYFLALVDVLEQMPSNNSNYETLKGYLDKLAAGLANYQDETSGCWYQVIDQKDNALTGNYLESSCTSLFAAAYLKAVNLKLLSTDGANDYKKIGENAFKGAVAQFMKCDTYSPASATTVQLVHNCASAGLGGTANRSGSRDYYINGSDVGQTNNKTEGKVMGAFIMAATEYEKANAKAIRFSYDLAPTYTLTQGQSLKVEALGSGAETATYQWYKKEGTTSTAVNDATSATFAPATSGSYYCEATTSDKATTIKTSTALVTVSEAPSNEGSNVGSGSGEREEVTISLANKNNTCSDANNNVTVDVTKSQPSSSSDYCKVAKSNYFTVSSEKTITKIVINYSGADYVPQKEGAVTVSTGTFVYNTTSTSSTWTGSANSVTFTDDSSNGNDLRITSIVVTYSTGTSSSLSITTQPTGATYDVNASSVTPLSVTVTGAETISYKWYSNTTNSTVGGREITTNGTSNTYTPPVTTAGTTYYYCIATAGGLSVTSDVVAVAVLNPSDLNYSTEYTYEENNAWTPAVNGTIDVSNLVTSSSKGAYSITSGNDVATISGTTITALKAGKFTLSQEADDKYKAGSKEITVRIGTDVTDNTTNSYSFAAQTAVSDGMKITLQDITMTFGNDGFWKQASADSYTGGQVNPTVPANNIPTAGTFYKFTPTTTGKLAVKVKLGTDGAGKLRPLYVSENGTLIAAKLEDGTQVGKGEKPEATEAYNNKSITFPVKANTDYYVYVESSKLGFYGFKFTPVTLYTVTFNAGSNGSCSTKSIMQESENATITLPSATPNTGYKFDGWYTEATGGTKEGDAGATYTPQSDVVTLYAHYTSTSSSKVIATFVNAAKTTWTAEDNNGFTITDVTNIKSDNSAKLSSGASITLNIPEGYTVTGFDFTLLCANTTEGSTLSVGDDEISVKDGTHTLHHMNLSASVTGPSTLTITNSGGKELNIASIKVYGSNGKSISFTTQPVSATYLKDATSPAALTVVAKVNNVTGTAPTISYQWYSNTTNSTDAGTAIDDQKGTSYTPDVSTAGTKYYYCKATATVDEEILEAYSNIATITVNNPILTIKTQPVGATYGLNQTGVAALMVEAETNTSETIKYQWYKKSSNSTLEAEAIGEDKATYEPAVSAVGTTYYYCVVKAGESLTATTNIVAIVVNNEQPIYGYKVSKEGLPAPDINSSKYITTSSDETGEKLVKMTFGGWKWNGGKYTKPDSETEITDTWKKSETVSGVTVLDGYSYWFSGTQDAKQENKDAETTMYGQTRNGWFVPPTREDGVTTKSHPYTLPVRGSFMTFEPTKNGTLTIYILQNGAWNTFDKATTLDGVSYARGDIKPGEFRMHAFQVTNQRGLVLEEFAPKYTVTNNQQVAPEYSCSKYAESVRPTTFDKTSKDISQWEEFWKLTENERKAVYDNWKNGPGGTQTIIKLDNGSFLAIQKAVVKYQFHVTGNETYYFFSNFSKMGFSGATFQPDGESGQPKDETTFSGDNSLSDIKAFPTIDKTADGTIGETGMTNYKYTINGEEVGKVDGVFIPQFKEITLNRTFNKDQWTTLTLPFNLTQSEVAEIFGEDTRIIILDKGTNNSGAVRLKFVYHEIQNVLPGYPYLIKPTKDVTTSFTVHNKCINPHISQLEIDCGDYIFKGVTGYCTPEAEMESYSVKFAEGDIFVSNGDGKLYISGEKSYSKGYRAYIAKKPGTLAAKSISIVMNSFSDDDDTTTSIDVAEFDPTLLESLGLPVGVYNLNGQRVGNDTRNLRPGIYIVNGKKTVVK